MDVVLALDVSTSVIGVCVLDKNANASMKPISLNKIDLRKNREGFWSKVDQMERELTLIHANVCALGHTIVKLCIEDPLERFRNGLSSAHTIALLSKFNALVSSHIRKLTKLDPLYIDATKARKAVGVPLLSKKKSGGIDQKQQTFAFLCLGVFNGEVWPLNKKGNVQPWVLDMVDAYVIAYAGVLGLGSSV